MPRTYGVPRHHRSSTATAPSATPKSTTLGRVLSGVGLRRVAGTLPRRRSAGPLSDGASARSVSAMMMPTADVAKTPRAEQSASENGRGDAPAAGSGHRQGASLLWQPITWAQLHSLDDMSDDVHGHGCKPQDEACLVHR